MVNNMKIVGIIVEYNPLHNGHVHHINKIKELAKPDLIIACMSGTYTMRGDLSLYNKFDKAYQALNNNVDLVIELPFVYSVERADIFAKNAVSILNLCGCNEIWIGSEENDIELYEKYYKSYNLNIPKDTSLKKASLNELPFKSNDLLGFFYYKAIKDNNYNIRLNTIPRINSDYLDKTPTNEYITSSTSIRNNLELLDKYTPEYVYSNKNILYENKVFEYLKYNILALNTNELKDIFLVDEGLENKLKEIKNFNNLNDYINHLTSKRYTNTRIKRMLAYVLFNIKKNEINEIYNDKISFIRILGYNDAGKSYINKIKKDIIIYSNIKNNLNKILDIELKISTIIDSICDTNLMKLEQKGPISK